MGDKNIKIHRAIFLLSLLKANNSEPIIGRTKLEKLLFLIRNDILDDTPFKEGYYFFEPYKYGPFTGEVLDDVLLMEDFGYLKKEKSGENPVYKITQQGIDKVNQIYQNLPKNIYKQLTEIDGKIETLKKEKNKLSLRNLLTYVYQRYPSYTINSEIRHKVLTY
ncbi:MAG: hypothetical protein MUO82_07560 [Candidatus Thermoplasmatota archaeon]|nr:hypothetical protein [Candidatus Thermoplasmatota archaeon]